MRLKRAAYFAAALLLGGLVVERFTRYDGIRIMSFSPSYIVAARRALADFQKAHPERYAHFRQSVSVIRHDHDYTGTSPQSWKDGNRGVVGILRRHLQNDYPYRVFGTFVHEGCHAAQHKRAAEGGWTGDLCQREKECLLLTIEFHRAANSPEGFAEESVDALRAIQSGNEQEITRLYRSYPGDEKLLNCARLGSLDSLAARP